MSSDSAFNKKLGPETTMDQVEGLLEHFSLPPKVIEYIRKHQRRIQVGLAVLLIAVVAWSLYGTHVEKMKEESASALAVAMNKTGEEKTQALQGVVDDYSSTNSAKWAKIELAHFDMKNGLFGEAARKYEKLLPEIDQDNAVYPLIVYGIAQAYEGDKNYTNSVSNYELLKAVKGFEHIGYTGMARIEEAQGNIDKAIAIYNNFLLAVADDSAFAEAKAEVDKKIARLKAKK